MPLLGDGAATYDNGLLTIEHVLPKQWTFRRTGKHSGRTKHCASAGFTRLANLVPLTQKRNSKAQNYDFDKKKSAYFGGKHGVFVVWY